MSYRNKGYRNQYNYNNNNYRNNNDYNYDNRYRNRNNYRSNNNYYNDNNYYDDNRYDDNNYRNNYRHQNDYDNNYLQYKRRYTEYKSNRPVEYPIEEKNVGNQKEEVEEENIIEAEENNLETEKNDTENKNENDRLLKEAKQIEASEQKFLENSKKLPEFSENLLENVEKYMKTFNTSVKAEKFKNYCYKDKENIKTVEIECPIDFSKMIIDISMNPKGVDEEKAYIDNPEYLNIIRRGNSLLEEYKYNERRGDYDYLRCSMLRKGMKKFLDLPFDFYIKEDKKLKLNITNEESQKNNTLKYIFYPVIQARKENYNIEIFKLMKANGENAQISYSKVMNAWAIASKNVCLMAKNRKDLEKYPPTKYDENNEKVSSRYSFAYKIGQCWFDILENFTESEITNLKNYLSNHTFIGEYVGNQFHQHLVRYMKHTILFFGIVENDDYENNSLTILESFSIFKKFKLDMVPYEYIGSYNRIEDVFITLRKLYIRIAESSIIDEEEGSVVYLCRSKAKEKDFNDKDRKKSDKVLSLCKLKTLEYRIYRKLREKIKNHLGDENNNYENSRRKISQFFEEVRVMLEGFSLPMPMNFYYKVAETAFDFVNFYQNNKLLANLQSNYIDFIETIHSIVDDTVNLKSRVIQIDNIMTYDYLIKNKLKAKKVVEIIIYAPPCYLSENFLKNLSNKFNCQIYNSFIPEDSYINITSDILIFHINMHNFRKINKLEKNKFIIFFGINENEIQKSQNIFLEKIKNPLFISYNKNKSLLPFIKSASNNDDNKSLNNLFNYYKEQSIIYQNEAKKNFDNQILIIDKLDEEKNNEYIEKISEIYNNLKKEIEKIDINSIEENSFYSNTKTLIALEDNSINTEKEKNKNIKSSKYKNSDLINLYEEHTNPYEALKQKFIDNQEKIYAAKYNKNENKNYNRLNTVNYNDKTKHIIILIPMTIPGNGKTYFIDQLEPMLEKYDIPFYFVSADLIRRDIMDNLVRKKRITLDQAFKDSGRQASFKFEEELQNVFDEIYNDYKIKKALIYIDKNHPPNAISRSTEPIRKYLSEYGKKKKLNLEFIALIPDCINNFEFTKNSNKSFIPFSLSYFIQCFLRVKHRDDHPTLNGNNKELMSIFGIFVQNFINVKLDEGTIISHHKLDKAIKLPFTDEIKEENFPDDLVKAFSSFCASLITNSRDNNNSDNKKNKNLCDNLEKLIMKYFPKNNEFFATKNLVKSTAEPIVSKLFNIRQNKIEKVENFIYLGILINNNTDNFIKNVIYSLDLIQQNFEQKEISELITKIQNNKNNYELPNGWKYPHKVHKNYWHCTTLFKGRQNIKSIKKTDEYNEYTEGKIININMIGFIYIPNKIMISIIDLNGEKCVNEFPHITTFINEFAPKQANDVMVGLFKNENDKEVCDFYKEKIKESQGNKQGEEAVFERNINVNGAVSKCYIVFFKEKCKLEGVMHAFE